MSSSRDINPLPFSRNRPSQQRRQALKDGSPPRNTAEMVFAQNHNRYHAAGQVQQSRSPVRSDRRSEQRRSPSPLRHRSPGRRSPSPRRAHRNASPRYERDSRSLRRPRDSRRSPSRSPPRSRRDAAPRYKRDSRSSPSRSPRRPRDSRRSPSRSPPRSRRDAAPRYKSRSPRYERGFAAGTRSPRPGYASRHGDSYRPRSRSPGDRRPSNTHRGDHSARPLAKVGGDPTRGETGSRTSRSRGRFPTEQRGPESVVKPVVKLVAKPSDERDPGVQPNPLQQLTSLQKQGAFQPQTLQQVETAASKAVTATAPGAITAQQDINMGGLTSEDDSMQVQLGDQTSESTDDSMVDNTDNPMIDNPVNSPKTPENNQSKRLRTPQHSPETPALETRSKRLRTTQPSQGKPASATGPKKSKTNQPSQEKSAPATGSRKAKTNRPTLIVKLCVGSLGKPTIDSGIEQSPPGSDGDGDSGSESAARPTLIVKLRIGPVANPPGSPSNRELVSFDTRQRKRLQDAISKGVSNNAMAEVQQLLANCPISFTPGDATHDLDTADVLSLPYFAGYEYDSWFTDNVIYALSRIEGEYVHDAYAEVELNEWFRGTNLEDLPEYIADAEWGNFMSSECIGWPFVDWKPQHNRCVAVINPSGVHWMAIEVSFVDRSPVVRYFNSMPTHDIEDESHRNVVHGISMLLYFASLRPDWPMGRFSLNDINAEHVECPRQARHSGDCGPLTFLCLARRLHGLPAFPDQIKLDTNDMRAAFGQWVRERCIHALWSRCRDTSFDTLFTELVDIDGFAAIESTDILATQAGQTGSEVRFNNPVARPTRLTMDSLDQLAYTDSRSADKPSLSEIYNLEFGEKRQGTLFVVIVFRWSGPPPWGRWELKTRQQCIDWLIESARQRLSSYLRQTKNTNAKFHVTIVAGGLVPTRDVPQTDDNERNARATLGSSATTLSGPEASVSVYCPFCDHVYTPSIRPKEPSQMYNSIGNHIVRAHMQQSKAKDDKCHIADCNWKAQESPSEQSPTRQLKKIVHMRNNHLGQWLSGKGKAISYSCDCRRPSCPGTCDAEQIRAHLEDIYDTVICPFEGCGRSYNDTYRHQSHLRYDHILDPLPVGWYRCLYANLSRTYATHCFGELTANQRTRLIQSCQRSKNKLFQCAWFPTECNKSGLMDMKTMQKHCQSSHLDNIWPFVPIGEETCGAVFQTQGQLNKHHLESHVLPGGPLRFTRLIDDALKRACRAAIEFGDDDQLPVLLSAGADGFTCNTSRFLKWMELYKFDFSLAIIEQLTILDTKYLLNDPQYFLGQYNSLTLLQALVNPEKASDDIRDLINAWDAKQDSKNAQSATVTRRN